MDVRADEAPKAEGKTTKREQRPPFDCIAFLLRGGGALGAIDEQGRTAADLSLLSLVMKFQWQATLCPGQEAARRPLSAQSSGHGELSTDGGGLFRA